ncbi:MAG: hypothetical protein JWQ57_4704 [Mucilaginibacter sp.]|nr:hypothetical protein [Mucilaginibacter sp.]
MADKNQCFNTVFLPLKGLLSDYQLFNYVSGKNLIV